MKASNSSKAVGTLSSYPMQDVLFELHLVEDIRHALGETTA